MAKQVRLEPCPCGSVPKSLEIVSMGQYKYALAVPSCCEEWMIEFRTVNYKLDSDETMDAAVLAWNISTRGRSINW